MQPKLILENTAYTLEQLQGLRVPQIALAGRSNVGKSSLVNALAGCKGLAKTSSTPGKTRSINFYRVDPDSYYVVDLPGYGYARCSKVEREKWARMIKTYLTQTPAVCGIAVLLDSRLSPQKLDQELVAFAAHAGIPILPVLTKADKCKQQERAKRQREWRELLGGITPLLFSSKTGMGKEQLWQALSQLVPKAAASPSY